MKFKNSTYMLISSGILVVIGFIVQSIQFARARTDVELEQMPRSISVFKYALTLAIILLIIGAILRFKKQ